MPRPCLAALVTTTLHILQVKATISAIVHEHPGGIKGGNLAKLVKERQGNEIDYRLRLLLLRLINAADAFSTMQSNILRPIPLCVPLARSIVFPSKSLS